MTEAISLAGPNSEENNSKPQYITQVHRWLKIPPVSSKIFHNKNFLFL